MVVAAGAVIGLSLNGGSYEIVARSATGAIAWALFLVLTLLGKWPRRWPAAEVWRVGAALAALTALAGLSMLWTESVEQSYLELTKLLLYLGVFALVAICAEQLGDRRPVVDGLSIGFGVVVLLAVLSRLEPSLFPVQELQRLTPETAPRLSYPFNYWNAVGLFAAMAIPLMLHQALREDRHPALRALAPALLPAAGLALYLTFSRGGLLAAAVGSAVLLALTPRRDIALRAGIVGLAGAGMLIGLVASYGALNDGLSSSAAQAQGHRVLVALVLVTAAAWALNRLEPERRVTALLHLGAVPPRVGKLLLGLVVVGVIAVATVAAVSQFDDAGSNATGGAASTNATSRYSNVSDNGRSQYLDAALDAWRDRPVAGIGAGTWQFWWRRNATLDAPVHDAHSMIFDELAELGSLGLVATLALFGSILWAGVRRRRERSDSAVVAALLGLVAAFTVSAAIDWTWEIPALGMIFFAAAGLLAAGGRRNVPDAVDLRASDARFAAGLFAGAVAWGAMFALLVPWFSAVKLSDSRQQAHDGDFVAALRSAKTAQSIEPWSASARLQVAQVLESDGEYGPALQKAQEAVDREPTNWENWFVAARIKAKLRDTGGALRDLATARRLNPRSAIWRDLESGPGPTAAIASPDFVPDDAGSSIVGGTVTRNDVLDGEQARIVEPGSAIEIPLLKGLTPGYRYAITLAVRPRTARPSSGRVGDTSGGGWGGGVWQTSKARRWQRLRIVLTATAAEERLAIRVDSGSPVAVDAIAVRRLGKAAS